MKIEKFFERDKLEDFSCINESGFNISKTGIFTRIQHYSPSDTTNYVVWLGPHMWGVSVGSIKDAKKVIYLIGLKNYAMLDKEYDVWNEKVINGSL